MPKLKTRTAQAAIPVRDSRLSPLVLVPGGWEDFSLIDSGAGRKLERYGETLLIRPEPQAFWHPAAPDLWRDAAGEFLGAEAEEDVRWRFRDARPEPWEMGYGTIRFRARCTPFRHLGFFPEQAVHWDFAAARIAARRAEGGNSPKVLNLFGYTGIASLIAANAGAEVTHVDASPRAVAMARENQALSGLGSAPIRWIVDDCLKYLAREAKRGMRYDGIILDPPKHGRGPKGEIWRLDEGLSDLLLACRAVLGEQPLFVAATIYAVRASFLALHQALAGALSGLPGEVESGEMALAEQAGGRLLPTAIFARFRGK